MIIDNRFQLSFDSPQIVRFAVYFATFQKGAPLQLLLACVTLEALFVENKLVHFHDAFVNKLFAYIAGVHICLFVSVFLFR